MSFLRRLLVISAAASALTCIAPVASAAPVQWGLADMGVPAAQARLAGAPAPLVAVIDTGADTGHPDLSPRLWTNPGEVPGNAVDDDGNGYVDDVHGWNALDKSADVTDTDGHGTHTAGIAAAISPTSQIMVVKVCGGQRCPETALVAGLRYAVANGARISVNAYSCACTMPALRAAIQEAGAAGHLVVAAAGNQGVDLAGATVDPASTGAQNVITVAASTEGHHLLDSSNRGPGQVHIAAPGDGIASAFPRGMGEGTGYASMSGTSMASAHVGGVAALVWAANPALSMQDVRARILGTARPAAALAGLVATSGVVDADAATMPTDPMARQREVRSRLVVTVVGGTRRIAPGGAARVGLRISNPTRVNADPVRGCLRLPRGAAAVGGTRSVRAGRSACLSIPGVVAGASVQRWVVVRAAGARSVSGRVTAWVAPPASA